MNPWLFVPAALVCAALDLTLTPVLSVAGFHPSLSAILLAFTALHASRWGALAGALLVGLYMDVAAPATFPSGTAYVIGPHAVACVVAACLLLRLRDSLFRKTALAVAAAVLVLAAAQGLVFVAIAGLRLSYADSAPLWGGGTGAQAFGLALGDAFYSAVLALPVGWVLLRTIGAWGFQEAGPRFAK